MLQIKFRRGTIRRGTANFHNEKTTEKTTEKKQRNIKRGM